MKRDCRPFAVLHRLLHMVDLGDLTTVAIGTRNRIIPHAT